MAGNAKPFLQTQGARLLLSCIAAILALVLFIQLIVWSVLALIA